MGDEVKPPSRNAADAQTATAGNGAPLSGRPDAIRIIIADPEPIYRVGMKKILAVEDDLRVVAQTENLGQTLAALAKFPADVILFKATISPKPPEAVSELLRQAPNAKIILVTNEVAETDTLEFLRRGIRGVVTHTISPDLLIRCIRKVNGGETWLDNKGVNWIVEAYRAQASQLTSSRPGVRLSDKELLIISGVTQGMKNKEIAHEIGTTEQVVKNYLRKIYDKLGVNDRLELALYCMHHRLLERFKPASPTPAAQSASATPVAVGAISVSAKSQS